MEQKVFKINFKSQRKLETKNFPDSGKELLETGVISGYDDYQPSSLHQLQPAERNNREQRNGIDSDNMAITECVAFQNSLIISRMSILMRPDRLP